MKPWGRFAFIFIAYGITLLHTAVPHHHPQPGNGELILVHNGCALPHGQGGLLQRVFSTDLGVGHLETFKQTADTQIRFSFGLTAVIPFIPRIDIVAPSLSVLPEFFYGYIEKLNRQRLLFSFTSFRAPPAI